MQNSYYIIEKLVVKVLNTEKTATQHKFRKLCDARLYARRTTFYARHTTHDQSPNSRSLYVHIAKVYAGNNRITLEIMEKNLCSFRDNAGGECGADPRDSTNKCEVVKLQSCLKEISNLWHCRQIDAECKRQQRDEVNCLRKTILTSQQISGFFSRLSA